MAETIFFMILTICAVFGVYCFLRLIYEEHCTPEGMQIALTLLSRDDVRALPDRLHEIFSRLSVPHGTLLVLVSESLYGDSAVTEELDAFLTGYDAELLVFSPEEKSDVGI